MQNIRTAHILTILLLTGFTAACTTIDPYTGQQKIDYGATAGVIGLGLGAAALGVAASKDDDDHDHRDTVIIDRRPGYHRPGYRPPYRPYRSPRRYR